MIIVSIVIVLLLLTGILMFSGITVKSVKDQMISARDYSVKSLKELRANRKISLKRQVELVTGKQKDNFLVRNFSEARYILELSGRAKRIRSVTIASVALGLCGLGISLLLQNVFLAPTLAIGLALLPSWYIKITESFLRKHLNTELEVALSTVTTSYVRSENLILAVEENLKYLNSPVKQVFLKFVNENKLINSNVIYGIQKMKMGLDNQVFHEWCDAMIQCQSDRTLKATLFPIVNKFSELKSVQEELDTLLMVPIRDFITVSLIVLRSITMMYMLNKQWFFSLVGTTGGKASLSIVSLCFFYGLNKAINLSKPIEYHR